MIDKSFQFRFIAGMQRNAERNGGGEDWEEDRKGGEGDGSGEGKEADEALTGLTKYFPCPAGCGMYLIKQDAQFDIVGDRVQIRLAECPCGALVCVQCEKLHASFAERADPSCGHKVHAEHRCKRGVSKDAQTTLNERLEAELEAEKRTAAAMARLGKGCPVCGSFIQKNDGCDWMTCGTTAHGRLGDCLRNGGCGIAFKWSTLKVGDDPCGWKDLDNSKKRGRPVTARQLKKHGGHPKCARAGCPVS